jgi:hypothetical protein
MTCAWNSGRDIPSRIVRARVGFAAPSTRSLHNIFHKRCFTGAAPTPAFTGGLDRTYKDDGLGD